MLVDRPGSQLQLPVEMMQRARTVWLASARKVRISQLHRDVSRALAELGVAHAKEQLTEDQLFSVDIALTGGHRSGYLPRCHGGSSCCKGAEQICCQPVAPYTVHGLLHAAPCVQTMTLLQIYLTIQASADALPVKCAWSFLTLVLLPAMPASNALALSSKISTGMHCPGRVHLQGGGQPLAMPASVPYLFQLNILSAGAHRREGGH